MWTKKMTWAALACGEPIQLAVDTEFQNTETLTIQFAVRVEGEVWVQLYHAPNVLPPSPKWFQGVFLEQFSTPVVVRPAKTISLDLSPARVLADLFGLPPAESLSRCDGDDRKQKLLQGRRSKSRKQTRLPQVNLIWVGHFLRADLLRAFGRNFYSSLLAPPGRDPAVALRDSKVMGFAGTGGFADIFTDPVVEYVGVGDQLHEIRLSTLDTNCVCGSTSLGKLAESYLNIGKDESITEQDKANMKSVFCDRSKVADAYRYAVKDSVLTLLVAEKMGEQHKSLYADFEIPQADVPPMHGTPGLRVATLLLEHARRTAAAGSVQLGASTPESPAKLGRLKELARSGSATALSDGRVSRYGLQTGDTHGGLLYSRTPFTFFHEAVGQFRDLDLKSCYPSIIRSMFAYLGRPVVLEPGHSTITLREAVEYLHQHADSQYAWFVKVSGKIQGFENTLIPSTIDAITNDNYRDRDRDRAARKANVARLGRKNQDWLKDNVNDRKYTALFTDEINAGVVTWATWLMIQALPPQVRKQYEALRAETIVFYPRKLAAGSGRGYDKLVAKYTTGRSVDWKQELDLERMTLTTVEDIDEKYVSLRYPVGQLTDRLVELRESAGKDTAAGLLYKTLANTVYGVFASPFLPTSNPVAGNVITGTARALAYAMMQALNGLLVITDGVLYRRDRIPADTFSERLRRGSDYPLLHAQQGKFLDSATIPEADSEFTNWYVNHVMCFFGVQGKPAYESLFRLHALSHKSLPKGETAFDGVFVDGSANYGKLVKSDTGAWQVADMKARAFGREGKSKLQRGLCEVYSTDQFTEPAPVVRSGRLLNIHDAMIQARHALAVPPSSPTSVPLGLKLPSITTYKLIKSSAFVFRTAQQRKPILTDWNRLIEKTTCGPELLAQRRTFGGSLSKVAKKLFEVIRDGQEELKELNVDRLYRPNSTGHQHGKMMNKRRQRLRERFAESLANAARDTSPLTGLIVDHQSLATIRAASTRVK